MPRRHPERPQLHASDAWCAALEERLRREWLREVGTRAATVAGGSARRVRAGYVAVRVRRVAGQPARTVVIAL